MKESKVKSEVGYSSHGYARPVTITGKINPHTLSMHASLIIMGN